MLSLLIGVEYETATIIIIITTITQITVVIAITTVTAVVVIVATAIPGTIAANNSSA